MLFSATNTEDSVQLLAQRPGTFYTGNLCAIKHEVRHHDPSDQELFHGYEIAVMCRTDCFRRSCRARNFNKGKSAPIHIYDAVSEVVATALARDIFHLPTFAEVMAEAPPTELPDEVPFEEVPAKKKRKS